jgi:hypothetical protein
VHRELTSRLLDPTEYESGTFRHQICSLDGKGHASVGQVTHIIRIRVVDLAFAYISKYSQHVSNLISSTFDGVCFSDTVVDLLDSS